MAYSKYKNKKVTIDGIEFDSIKEGNRYAELKLLEKVGIIKDLELQPKFELIPKYKIGGRSVRKMEYVADFKYIENGKVVIEDVKGMKTEVYKIKKKLFEFQYGIEVREIY
jgi:hypothetical protein